MSYPHYSSQVLVEHVLCHATKDELLQLSKIVDESRSYSPSPWELGNEVLLAGGNSLANTWRGHGIAYSELLFDAAITLKIDKAVARNSRTSSGLTIEEMEERAVKPSFDMPARIEWKKHIEAYLANHEHMIISRFIENAYMNMTPEQRARVDREVQMLAEQIPGKDLKGLGSSAAFLVVANAGGFTTYMLMSSVISTLTLGAASFGVYTTASSILSVILGPVGWGALGIAAVYKFAAPNEQKVLRAALGIAMIRARLAHAP